MYTTEIKGKYIIKFNIKLATGIFLCVHACVCVWNQYTRVGQWTKKVNTPGSLPFHRLKYCRLMDASGEAKWGNPQQWKYIIILCHCYKKWREGSEILNKYWFYSSWMFCSIFFLTLTVLVFLYVFKVKSDWSFFFHNHIWINITRVQFCIQFTMWTSADLNPVFLVL